MSPLIALNGIDIRGYGLSPLAGTIAALIAPPKYKKPVSNENSFIHGALLLSNPIYRRLDKKDISLSFFLKSTSQGDLKRSLDSLVQTLVNGVKEDGLYTGVNTMSLPEYGVCLRLVFLEVSKFTPWIPANHAVITLKFTEPNPINRSLPTAE